MTIKLSEKDYNKLIIEIALKTSPNLIGKIATILFANGIAFYTRDTDDPVKTILKKQDETNAQRIQF